ncbi:MAG TPA: type 1 glutamine amidotransferase [Microlunatus sp.]|nr:type 1 glutamine amidotransferase [Microlunatus sp.]
MRVLVIQHDHICLPGAVGDRLIERGYELVLHQVVEADRFTDPSVDTDFPDPTTYDAVVALGAPWSAYDHATIGSWVLPELELLRQADAADVPVMGICFGGQLLALAHGGTVARAPQPELGWIAISSDDPEIVDPGPWFQWHYDRWTLPPAATELARNPRASQAFVLGRNLALQFHPEMTPEILDRWLATGGLRELDSVGVDSQQLRVESDGMEPGNRARASRLVDAFLDQVATRPASGRERQV